MGRFTKKEMPMWAKTGHKKPVSRRDFLSLGVIPFAASALMPNVLGLLASPEAHADAAACATASGILPSFVTINLSGGPGLMANFIPRDAGGALLPSYSKIGGGTANNITLAPDMAVGGAQPFAASSGLLAGLKAGAPTALANTSVVAVCVQSRDDNAQNTFDASGMVYMAGLAGSMLPNMGTRATSTGIGQFPAVVAPPAPLIVSSVDDVKNSIGYTAALKSTLTQDQRQKVARLVSSLSASQAQKLGTQAAPIQTLIDCAGVSNSGLIGMGGSAVDPTVSMSALNSVWNISSNTNAKTQNYVFATLVYNSLAGNGGVVGLELGGYDYHDGSRTTGDNKDKQAGMVIGQVLESAKAMNKKIFVYVCADGATASAASDNPGSVWVSDGGSAGMALMFMYDPAGRPATKGLQVGNFTTGQVADDTTFVGSDPAQAAQAVFANYLSFGGRMDLLTKVLPSNGTLSGATLQSILKV